jgi:NADH-quinone oxidoreductase subunit N
MNGLDLRPVYPALILAVTGVFILLLQAFARKGERVRGDLVALLGLFGALSATFLIRHHHAKLGEALIGDEFSVFFHVLILGVGVLVVLLSPSYLAATGLERGEYYSLLLFSMVGMLGLVSAIDLISIFVALEIMSVALYALAGLDRNRLESQESAVKYFLTGAFSSAFFLYGVAVLYGLSGSTALDAIASTVAHTPRGAALPLLAAGLLLVGFGFKVASVPFHMWTPDVYEGAPTTVTAFMAAGVKAAAFGALLRVFGRALPTLPWHNAVAALAAITMVIGNLGALAQSNLKRMLAFSSVAHAGYLLTALVAAPVDGGAAVLFYLVAYAAVNLGGFGALASLTRANKEPLSLTDLAGLAERRPALAAALAIYMVSLTGVPVSAGFVGKFYLFGAAVKANYAGLAVVGMLMSVVSAYYYLRVVVVMYMREPIGDDNWSPLGVGPSLALAVAVAVILGLGIYPVPVLNFARSAAEALL